MKPLLIIPACITSSTFLGAALAMALGARFNPLLPVTAGGICTIAAFVGIVPLLYAKSTDTVGLFQLALVGTVLHLAIAVILTFVVIGAKFLPASVAFICWILGAYWISLIVLLWQLHQRLLILISPVATKKTLQPL